MKIKNKLFYFWLFLLSLNSYSQKSDNLNPKTMKEYVLLFRYPNITYTVQQNEELKQQWIKVLAGWKAKGIFISSQVLAPEGTLITADGKANTNTFAEDNSFLGATVTLLAKNKEQAIALGKETPVLAVGGSIEIREPRQLIKTPSVIFIDAFIVPEEARKAFLERVEINRNLLKTLPGFIEDHAYEKEYGDGKFNYITVAKWESEEAINNAKKEVITLYVKQKFNIQEFLKTLNITLERAVYSEIR